MKEIEYWLLPGVGPGRDKVNGSLYELLNSIPYLFCKKRLPPISVINSILESGLSDAGMSGGVEWNAFTISESDYAELADYCSALGFEITNPPEWVKNRNYFQIWEFEIDHGIPWEVHKKLSDEVDSAESKMKVAQKNGESKELLEKLHLEWIEASMKLSDLINDTLT